MEVNQEKIGAVTDKIDAYRGKVDAVVEKGLGLVGDHPWENWMKVFTEYASKFLPAVIAVSGIIGFLVGLIMSIKNDAPFSVVMGNFGILVATVFSMHLAPKALALPQSFISQKEPDAMRPELLYILKVLLGLGGVIMALVLLCEGLVQLALVLAVLAILQIIICTRPALVGIKPGYPTNAVEEFLTMVLLPLKIVLALLPFIVVVAAVGGFIYGVTFLFKGEFAIMVSPSVFGAAALAPLLLPLAVYVLYLFVSFTLDLYSALVSIPRKLDEVKKAIEDK